MSSPTECQGWRDASLQNSAVLRNFIVQFNAAAESSAIAAESADMEIKGGALVLQLEDMLKTDSVARALLGLPHNEHVASRRLRD